MYKPTKWLDHVLGVQEGTPVDASRLNNIEAGTMEAETLSAFYASQQNAGGNLPHRESREKGGGYFCEVPLLYNYYGMFTEREWAIKPSISPGTERRTTDRFYGCPVYEVEFCSLSGDTRTAMTYQMTLSSDKKYTGRKFFVVGVEGTYSTLENQSDVWKPINDGIVSVKVSRAQASGAPINSNQPMLEVSTTMSSIPAHAIRVRYIFVDQS